MSHKTLQACRKANDFICYAKNHHGKVVNSKKGVKVFGPKGASAGFAEIHANHPKELATGTRCALIKAFIALGLGVLVPLSCLIMAIIS